MNENPSQTHVCPRCASPLPANAPEGLCPRCLAALHLGTETVLTESDSSASKVPPPAPSEIAPHFPQLEIVECLGRGGMGVVYKARQKTLNRLVALKILAPEKEKDPQFAERFAREAQALARLQHPNIVTVHDFGHSGGLFFLIMEFVDGLNLRELFRSQPLKPDEALAIVPPICEALQYAHNQGIVHRDIKPDNILLDKQGQVKIADFGIAKIMGNGARSTGSDDQSTVGTPQYMAPEQKDSSEKVDHRADIYSLGVVLYEMLTGEIPKGEFQPPSRKVQIDVRLDAIVLRALEKVPELRFQQASDVRTAVETVTSAGGFAPPEVGDQRETVSDTPMKFHKRYTGPVLSGLMVTAAILISGLIPWLPVFRGVVTQYLHSGVFSRMTLFLSAGLVGWVLVQCWFHRNLLFGALGLEGDAGGEDRIRVTSAGHWLCVTVETIFTVFILRLGFSVFLSLSSIYRFGSADFSDWMVWMEIAAYLAVFVALVRSLWCCTESAQPSEPSAEVMRAGIVFLAAGLFSVVVSDLNAGFASLVFSSSPDEGGVVVRTASWSPSAVLSVTGAALLVRKQRARSVALALNLAAILIGIVSELNLIRMVVRSEFPEKWTLGFSGSPYSVAQSCLLSGLVWLGFIAGILILCRRDVRACFGLNRDVGASRGEACEMA